MKIIILLLLVIIAIILFLIMIINSCRYLISYVRHKKLLQLPQVLRKNGILLTGILILLIVFIVFTQLSVSTPPIKDEQGNIIENSIAELISVDINGHKEWISIRGKNKEAPILLFLAGGPGGTQMAATRYELSALEEDFVIVNWDQPGSGKSYNCMKRKDITVKTYIDDGIALTEYLRDKFSKEKIYIVGESWGSALGVFLIFEKPEYFAGFIGTGQMVDFQETEIIDYKKALEIANEKGDKKIIEKLTKQGEPLYEKGNISLLSATYLNYLSTYMTNNPEIYNSGFNTFRDMFSSEYGLLDSINFMLGVVNTFNVVYPQLYKMDLRESYTKLEVPIYFFIGRHDVNAPINLMSDYYNILEAPHKEIIWFEHSGHNPWINENKKFVQETKRVFYN